MIEYEKLQEAKFYFTEYSVPVKDGAIAIIEGITYVWKDNKWVEVEND